MRLLTPTFERPKPIYRQIVDHVRSVIDAGQYRPGDRLPSTVELAEAWKTTPRTAHMGLIGLEKEGILVRVPKRGTFVCKPEKRLSRVGLYYAGGDLIQNSEFLRLLHTKLESLLSHEKVKVSVWSDPRPCEQQNTAWRELEQAAEERQIQGVIVTCTDWPHIEWLSKLSTPVAFFSAANNLTNGVYFDYRQMIAEGLKHLKSQGCRSVGLICGIYPAQTNPDGTRHLFRDIYECFAEGMGNLELCLRKEWVRSASERQRTTTEAQKRFGYDQFHWLWSLADRPDGLIVYPDTAVNGVVMAILERQVKIPRDLKLVLHRNEGSGQWAPFAAAYAITPLGPVARALLTQITRQMNGKPCKYLSIPFKLRIEARSEDDIVFSDT